LTNKLPILEDNLILFTGLYVINVLAPSSAPPNLPIHNRRPLDRLDMRRWRCDLHPKLKFIMMACVA